MKKHQKYPKCEFLMNQNLSIVSEGFEGCIHDEPTYSSSYPCLPTIADPFLEYPHLQIMDVPSPKAGQHNAWRSGHTTVYDKETRTRIIEPGHVINSDKALDSIAIKWNKQARMNSR
jgi:hypothetical protein